jgi:hypothetical protein
VVTCYHYYISIDPAYDLSPVALWDMVEMTLIVIIACLPSLPMLFRDPRARALLRPIKSWSTISGNNIAHESQWHRSTRGMTTSPNRDIYSHIEEYSLTALSSNPAAYGTQSTHSGSLPQKLEGGSTQPNNGLIKSGIMRTTRFETEVDYEDGQLNHHTRNHLQHPWTAGPDLFLSKQVS